MVGPSRALLPSSGPARREALQRIALANGAVDKIGGGVNYETLIRPKQYRWPEWIERCKTQGRGALAALDAVDWPKDGIDQAQITTACAFDYIQVTIPELAPKGRYHNLDRLTDRLRARPEFKATAFTDYAVPKAG
jgi:glutathione S-transferase